MSDFSKQVEELVGKAAKSDDKDDAMRFSQAALNVANAAQVLSDVKGDKK